MTVTAITLDRARINGFVLRLIEYREAGEVDSYSVFEVNAFGPDDDADDEFETEGLTEPEARALFAERKLALADTPNHAAQAAYDDAHGTDNGFAPWQSYREE